MSKKAATVSAAQGRAFFALLLLSKDQLQRRPASALADALGIDLSGAQRHVAALKKSGLLGKVGRYGVRPRVPSDGWLYHRHSQDRPCLGEPRRVARQGDIHQILALSSEACIRIEPEACMADKTAIEKLKGIAEVYERKRGRPGRPLDRKARLLVAAYTAARRKRMPGYTATKGTITKAKEAVARLNNRMIDQDLYREYVEYAFKAFSNIARRRGDGPVIPPVAFLKAETIIDNFLATLGRRDINVEKAQEMLAKAGIKGDPGMAVTMARNKIEGLAELPEEMDEDLRAAATFVIEHFEEIGYRPVG